ncbi:MAG: 2-amino-4-hydroxy-6-hydroxymethyldihydropteridine diphosphokinase [Pseudomonadota bacterium]
MSKVRDVSVWYPAYVALGSNLGDSMTTLKLAVKEMDDLPDTRLVCQSPWYRSEPWGTEDRQPDYLNGVAGLLTQLSAYELLQRLFDIETSHGRQRTTGERYSARTLDLDLLLYHELEVDSGGLTVPHPRMHLRNFVIYPLADIAPTIQMGKLGIVAHLRGGLPSEGLERAS